MIVLKPSTSSDSRERSMAATKDSTVERVNDLRLRHVERFANIKNKCEGDATMRNMLQMVPNGIPITSVTLNKFVTQLSVINTNL